MCAIGTRSMKLQRLGTQIVPQGGAVATVDFNAEHTQWDPSPLTDVGWLQSRWDVVYVFTPSGAVDPPPLHRYQIAIVAVIKGYYEIQCCSYDRC